MTPEEMAIRLVDAARRAIFDELKDMRPSREEATKAIHAVAAHRDNLYGRLAVALGEYISYCEAVEIE